LDNARTTQSAKITNVVNCSSDESSPTITYGEKKTTKKASPNNDRFQDASSMLELGVYKKSEIKMQVLSPLAREYDVDISFDEASDNSRAQKKNIDVTSKNALDRSNNSVKKNEPRPYADSSTNFFPRDKSENNIDMHYNQKQRRMKKHSHSTPVEYLNSSTRGNLKSYADSITTFSMETPDYHAASTQPVSPTIVLKYLLGSKRSN